MQITVDIDEMTFKALNNAFIAYKDMLDPFIIFGLRDHIPSVLQPLTDLPVEDLKERQQSLLRLYKELEQYFPVEKTEYLDK